MTRVTAMNHKVVPLPVATGFHATRPRAIVRPAARIVAAMPAFIVMIAVRVVIMMVAGAATAGAVAATAVVATTTMVMRMARAVTGIVTHYPITQTQWTNPKDGDHDNSAFP